jgi:hypothetical protein
MKKDYIKILISSIAFLYSLTFLIDPISKSLEGSIINAVNLIFHEAGHWMFYICGDTIYTLMGSGTEVLIPVLCSIHLYSTNQKFSAYFLLYWVTIALVDVSIYIDDSIIMQIPLLGGDSATHDWNHILSEYNLLAHTHTLSHSVFILACVCLITGFAGTLYVQLFKESVH